MFLRSALVFLAVPALLLTQQNLRLPSKPPAPPVQIRQDVHLSLDSLPAVQSRNVETEANEPAVSAPAIELVPGFVEPITSEKPVTSSHHSDSNRFGLPSSADLFETKFASSKAVVIEGELVSPTDYFHAEILSLTGPVIHSVASDQSFPVADHCNCRNQQGSFSPTMHAGDLGSSLSHPAMYTDNYRLRQYRRMMINGQAPQPYELQGSWRGLNKGIATVALDEQFVKHFHFADGQLYGDNISVRQVPRNQLGVNGWQPIFDRNSNGVKRQGKFLVQPPQGRGVFGNSAILNYRQGGNRRRDPSNLIVDQIVKLDDNHMLGRATAKFGPIKIPLAYFVLERVEN